jgi:hypothetical protein
MSSRSPPEGTALITAFNAVRWDGSALHLGHHLSVLDCIIQGLDIRTGNVLFHWDSLDHLPSATRMCQASGPRSIISTSTRFSWKKTAITG